MLNKSPKSFTLIELLVVIAIIGLLAAIVMVSVSGTRAKARDAKRQTELDQIRKALEMYNISKGKYPTQDSGYCCIEAKSGEECQCDSFAGDIASYLPTIPADSLYNPTQSCGEDKYGYQYKTENEGETYEVYAKKEQGGFFKISSGLGTIAYSLEGPGYTVLSPDYCATHNGSSTSAGQNIYCADTHMWSTTLANGYTWGHSGYTVGDCPSHPDDTYPACYACYNLDYAGFTDWVLPNKDTLKAFWDGGELNCGANCTAWDTKCCSSSAEGPEYYWSSTEYSGDFAWYVYFVTGRANYSNKGSSLSVRCVMQ